jgi:phosphatidylglycerol:prolipoprotein diacylglycerol transferase
MIPYFEWKTILLGPITIQVWGLWVALGMLFALYLVSFRSKQLKLNPERMLDMSLWMIVSGIIFSRIFEVIFYESGYYFSNSLEIIKIWRGGLSSFGGLFGAVLAFFIFAKRKKIGREEMYKVVDIISFSALFGWIIGRIGCLMIHDHWGAYSKNFLAINTSTGPRLEMALLEILGLIPLAIIFYLNRKKQKADTWFTSVLFMYYAVLRFILDFFRATDVAGADSRYFGLTPGHYSAILLLACGIWLYRKKK